MLYNFFNIIILLGCLQGFILSALLLIGPKKNLASRLLATLLFLLSLASLNIYVSESATPWQVGFVLSLVPTIILMPFGPLIYFYTRSVLDPSFRLKGKEKRQFLPVIIDVLPAIAGWILTIGYILKSFSQNYLLQGGDIIDQYNSYSDIPRWISITAYLLLTKRFLNQYQATSKKQERQRHRSHLGWLSFFLNSFLVFQLIWLVFLIPYIIPSFTSLAEHIFK